MKNNMLFLKHMQTLASEILEFSEHGSFLKQQEFHFACLACKTPEFFTMEAYNQLNSLHNLVILEYHKRVDRNLKIK